MKLKAIGTQKPPSISLILESMILFFYYGNKFYSQHIVLKSKCNLKLDLFSSKRKKKQTITRSY